MANKYLAKGAKITVAVSSTQTLIGGAKKITPPDDDLKMWDATDLADSDVVVASVGYLEPGKVTFDFFFDSKSVTHALLMTSKYSKTALAFVITGPTSDPYTFTFNAFVTKLPPATSEVGKGQEGTCELSLTTVATYAAAP